MFEKTLKTSRKEFPQLKTERRNHNRIGRRSRHDIVRTHTPGPMTHKQEEYHNCRSPPQGTRGPGSTSGSAAWRSCTGKMSPQMSGFENQQGLCMGELRATGIRDSTLKWAHKTSQSKHRGSHLRGAWVRPTCWAWRASWRDRRQLGSPWRRRPLRQPFGELVLAQLYQHWQTPFWSTLCSLLALGTQPWPPDPQVTQMDTQRPGPTHQLASSRPKPPRPHSQLLRRPSPPCRRGTAWQPPRPGGPALPTSCPQ